MHAHETQLLVPYYLREVVAAQVELTDEEKLAFYEKNKQTFLRPPRVRLAQITVPTLEQAEQIHKQLVDGADLTWLARQHSIDRLKETGGDRGWLEPSPGVDPFHDWVLHAQPGDVREPFGAEGNFIVVKAVAREEQGPYPYEQISGNVREALFNEKFRAQLDLFISTLRSRAEIEVYQDRLEQLAIRGTVDESGEAGGHAHAH